MSHLNIGKGQMKALSADVDRRFTARMVRHLAQVLPPADAPQQTAAHEPAPSADDRFRPLISQGMAYADAHRFEHEDEVALVVVVHVGAHLFPDIEEMLSPWAAEVLERDESSTLIRLAWIEHQVAERAGKNGAARRLQTALQCTRETFG
jgi:hypothetical protein